MTNISYSKESAGVFLALVALQVARGVDVDAAARRADEVWLPRALSQPISFSAADLTAMAHEALGT